MEESTRRAHDRERDFENKAFRAGCYAPFVSLYFNTLGKVIACCRNQNSVLGDVTKERLDDIWNGERIRRMRDHLSRYEFGGGCEFCEWMIEAGDQDGAITHLFERFEVDSMQPAWPRMMEFALSNTCNFACIQCCGDWSSTIRAHREGMPALPRVYDDRFFSDLRKYLPHLEQAKFYGGEPFLAQENHRIWDMLIQDGLSPECHVLTNGSQWNAKIERVLDHLRFSIGVSLDAITKERLEKIRVNADFDLVMANMTRFRAYTRSRGTPMMVSFSWMQQNQDELGPMLLHCEEHGYDINVIRVIEPSAFSLFSLPTDELRRIADRLHAKSDTVLPYLHRHRGVWLECLQSLYSNADERQAESYRNVGRVAEELRRDSVARASELMAEGRWAETIAEAQKTPQTHKDYFHALFMRCHCLRRLGDLEASEQLMQEAMTLTQRHPRLWIERAWLRLEQGRFADGLADANHAASLQGARRENLEVGILHLRGALLARLGDVEGARQAVERWIELEPGRAFPRIECARTLHYLGNHSEALTHLESALELAENQQELIDCLLDVSRLRRQLADIEGSRQAIQQALELEPGRADLHVEHAWFCFDRGQFARCVASARHARSLLAGSADSALDLSVSHALGHALCELGRFELALPELQRFLAARPDDQDARWQLENATRRVAEARAAVSGLSGRVPRAARS